ncbi:hypothetical protein BT96DRAFT_157925 [Gymnopus androsaceus JB14]|uniref:F-box domain-containing protein n=1 Tax=Gymnopus androsaceus JB14 TaxID=1447944 RepID=A0A6A4HAF2_9AGAR|nr:hypothetical protein BT96DRAFT_157925 [Gymnopus androsaceus JB14]
MRCSFPKKNKRPSVYALHTYLFFLLTLIYCIVRYLLHALERVPTDFSVFELAACKKMTEPWPLEIPELLVQILSHLEPIDLQRSALLVNRQWAEICLDFLWYEVEVDVKLRHPLRTPGTHFGNVARWHQRRSTSTHYYIQIR